MSWLDALRHESRPSRSDDQQVPVSGLITAGPNLISKVKDASIVGEYDFTRLQLTLKYGCLIPAWVDAGGRPENLVAINTIDANKVESVLVNAFRRG